MIIVVKPFQYERLTLKDVEIMEKNIHESSTSVTGDCPLLITENGSFLLPL